VIIGHLPQQVITITNTKIKKNIMSNIINEEINKMLYLFDYKPGKVISEQEHPELGEGRKLKYTDDEIRRESLKYKSVPEFKEKSFNLYQAAIQRKMLDDLFPDRIKTRTLTDDDIRKEASNYKTRKEFELSDKSMYITALKRNLIDELFPIKYPKKYTDDDIIKIASNYETSREFKEKNHKMWYQAYLRGLLDVIFPNRNKGRGRPKSPRNPDINIDDYWTSTSTGNFDYKYEN